MNLSTKSPEPNFTCQSWTITSTATANVCQGQLPTKKPRVWSTLMIGSTKITWRRQTGFMVTSLKNSTDSSFSHRPQSLTWPHAPLISHSQTRSTTLASTVLKDQSFRWEREFALVRQGLSLIRKQTNVSVWRRSSRVMRRGPVSVCVRRISQDGTQWTRSAKSALLTNQSWTGPQALANHALS